jgi:hypothetical protein
MAQAECIITVIRELMSRGRPPQSANPVRLAHTEFVAALAGNVTHPIYLGVNADDLDGRANHLEKVFAALHAYLSVIVGDTAENIPGGALDGRYPAPPPPHRFTRNMSIGGSLSAAPTPGS